MTAVTAPLDQLRAAIAQRGGLVPLDPAAYARAHATYEAHSDQRALLTDCLTGALDRALPGPAPRAVLSIGPGDGSVDAPLAAALTPGRGPLRWVAAEPDRTVGARCRTRVAAALGRDADVVLHVGTFDSLADTVGGEAFDLVLAVHSLYYVPDLARAVAAARDRLAPGGSLVLALAPLEELCLITAAVDPDSHRWWSGDLVDELTDAGLQSTTVRLAGRLDVTDCADPTSATGAAVLDFLVGADCSRLDVACRAALLDALASITVSVGKRRLVPHPVDVLVVRDEAPGSSSS